MVRLKQLGEEKELWFEKEIESIELAMEKTENTKREKTNWLETEIEKLEQKIHNLEQQIGLKEAELRELL